MISPIDLRCWPARPPGPPAWRPPTICGWQQAYQGRRGRGKPGCDGWAPAQQMRGHRAHSAPPTPPPRARAPARLPACPARLRTWRSAVRDAATAGARFLAASRAASRLRRLCGGGAGRGGAGRGGAGGAGVRHAELGRVCQGHVASAGPARPASGRRATRQAGRALLPRGHCQGGGVTAPRARGCAFAPAGRKRLPRCKHPTPGLLAAACHPEPLGPTCCSCSCRNSSL
jgi:hypothetical protein